jgi:AraC-like DNA-binding protein
MWRPRGYAARGLLEAGATTADTAARTGFADQSHLHRQFQRTLGVTPAEYRRRFQQGSHQTRQRRLNLT